MILVRYLIRLKIEETKMKGEKKEELKMISRNQAFFMSLKEEVKEELLGGM